MAPWELDLGGGCGLAQGLEGWLLQWWLPDVGLELGVLREVGLLLQGLLHRLLQGLLLQGRWHRLLQGLLRGL